jgi:rod shape determining protein RodA
MWVLKNRDYKLDVLVLFILLFGLFSIFSVSPYFFTQQTYFAVFGLLVYTFLPLVQLSNYKLVFPLFYGLILILLIFLFTLGTATRGSASWLNFGVVNFQPSEFAKIVVIFYLASIFSAVLGSKKRYIYLLVGTLPILILVFLQPDFGTFLLLLLVILSTLYIHFSNIKYFLFLFLFGVVLAISGFGLLQDYQKLRITSFLDPSSDPLGAGYNVIQSKIAIGSGGMFGKGFGQNTQVALNFLPEPHTDFIFAAASESFGFVYSSTLLILLFTLAFYIFYTYVNKSKNTFMLYFGFSVFTLLLAQILLNIGMNMGLLPVTGLPLPLVSYGGSSLLSFLILFGFLQLLYKESF